eukprot:gene458-831_t
MSEFTSDSNKTAEFCKPCDDAVDQDRDKSDDESFIPPVHRLVIPADVTAVSEDDDVIYVIGTRAGKVTKIAGLEGMHKLKELILRSCLISSMEGIEHLTTLTKLELYDNQILRISSIENLKNLTILDISFNNIRDMSPVAVCPLLEELYIAQNKLRTITGLGDMKHLRILDLGANRIRVCMKFLPYLFCE